MSAIGIAFVSMDLARRNLGESIRYPPPRTRFLAIARHLMAFSDSLYEYRNLHKSSYFDINQTPKDLAQAFSYSNESYRIKMESSIRHFHFLSGSIWDLTQLQMLIDEEEKVPGKDSLWPLKDAFPYVVSSRLIWTETNFLDNYPDLSSSVEKLSRKMAETASKDFNVSLDECLSFLNYADQWTSEIDELISISNEKYRHLTKEFRKWEID